MSWLVLVMVCVTFLVVVLRYLFSLGWVWLQEIVVYAHAIVFLLACGATLTKDGHVRVDIWFQRQTKKTQAWVNLLGALFLLLPVCALIFFQSWPYVLDSWKVFEGSKDGGGLEGVFVLKTFILLFCLTTALQGVSLTLKSVLQIRGES